MAGRLRYLLALAFAAVYFLIPEPDHGYLAFLKTRAWLMGDDTPFATALAEGTATTLPPVVVDVAPRDRVAEYERIAREWTRTQGVANAPGAPLQLVVRVGDQGFRSTLFADAGQREIGRLELLREGGGDLSYYPDRQSLLPAFLAIMLAILTGKVIPSLLLGCLLGSFLYVGRVVPSVTHFLTDTVCADVFASSDGFNSIIMGFVVFLFMAVGVMTRSGGIQGMVEWVRKLAKGPVSTQLCAYVAGLLIFFDDYSNCILCGTTMRPLADRNRVSREKLSYIVDSTAAPIAGISLFSTWVAYEISMFKDQLPEVTKKVTDAAGALVEIPYATNEGFSVFLQTLPFRFYCIFTLLMVLLTILLRREFGPMLTAERRARHEGKPIADNARPMLSRSFSQLQASDDIRHLARNAVVPVLVLVVLTITLIYRFGAYGSWLGSGGSTPEELAQPFGERIRAILNNTASHEALFWASLVALVVAAAMAIGQGMLSVGETVRSAVRSARALVFAVVILILAWSIGFICKDLGTAHFLTAAFYGSFEPWLLPLVMFLLSALVAFSTGTSYGTMAILLPNIVVLAHAMGETDAGLGGSALMILTIGAVLEGSIFGDHCSPISDTTVLSSVATASDHLHHVQTQAPYALFVMVVAMVCGYLPVALVSPTLWPLSWGLAIAVMAGWLLFVGRRPDR